MWELVATTLTMCLLSLCLNRSLFGAQVVRVATDTTYTVWEITDKSVVQKCTSTDSHSPRAFSVNNQTHKAHKNKPIFTALHCCSTKHFRRQTKAPTALEIRDFVPIQHKLYLEGSCETLFKFRFVFSFAYL